MPLPHPRDLPIRQKILLIGLLPGCVGLALACAIFVISEKSDFTNAYTDRLGVLAEIVAKNVGPQLAARDHDAAALQLESLRSDPHLLSAAIHDTEGNLFAGATFRAGVKPGSNETSEGLTLYHPILMNGKPIGTVQVRASMELLDEKVIRYAWVTLLVLVISGGIALLIAMRLRRWISTPVTHLSQRMREIAEGEGDLTRNMEIEQDDEVGQLAYWFNTFLAAQRDRVALIAGNARLLGASSDQMATISEQMSSNAEETSNQASVVNTASERVSGNLQRVAAAAEQLHGGAREIAAHVSDSVAVADKAVREASQTNDTLARLTLSSDEIGAVVKVINSIAEQTNLLALNATIEAARAGESGRGFGVVANEVKELARGTANATEDIARRIQAIQDDSRAAVGAIERIGKVIHHIRGIQKEIAIAMEEQTLTTNEIGKNVVEAARSHTDITGSIGGVADAARMTAAGVQETKRAAGELAKMAAELESLVGRFDYEEPEEQLAHEIAVPDYE
ncbi:MAG: methyl-accepting chemotaxis protein [Planctomycetota bacterium]|jgi:methyl-accepting chemotaxis protein